MPFKYSWYIEGKIISIEIWGEQTLEELRKSNAVALEYLNSAKDQFVHVIINDEKMTGVPISVYESQKVLTYTKHPKIGWVVMVNSKDKGQLDKIQNHVITLVARLARVRFIRVKTFEKALEHLRSVDQTLLNLGDTPVG